MRRCIAVLAVAAAAAAAFYVPERASADVTSFTLAQQRCEAAGGVFIPGAQLGLGGYVCVTGGNETSQLGGAQAICEHAYGGTFFVGQFAGPEVYECEVLH